MFRVFELSLIPMQPSGQPPEAPSSKRESRGGRAPAAAAGGAAGPRQLPKPPALPQRLILLCLSPESWPTAARYPTRYTLVALGVAIAMLATAVGIADGIRATNALNGLAAISPRWKFPPTGVLKTQQDFPGRSSGRFFPGRWSLILRIRPRLRMSGLPMRSW